jgi:dynein heavy chain
VNLFSIFLANVKRNLHIVLAMSPIGTGFRNKLRMFPSLVNACTIDWFTEWPEDALEKVATNFLEEMEMTDDVRKRCVVMCKHFHNSVKRMSAKYAIKRFMYYT